MELGPQTVTGDWGRSRQQGITDVREKHLEPAEQIVLGNV